MPNRLEKHTWEGRSWLDIDGKPSISETQSFRFLCYNSFADCKSTFINHSAHTHWEVRSRTLLEEIKSYNADILCMQDVDHFKDFWRPKLMLLGYESVFKMRTQTRDYHYEGVMISYKSDVFQLFKTVPIEFNNAVTTLDRGSSFLDRSKSDDVGLILFLQPMPQSGISSALCVGNAMFSEDDRNSDVRMIHSQYFANQIEFANKEFHVPVLLGMNLNDTPSSLAYNLLVTGRTPLSAQVPAKCQTPVGEVFCRGSVLLRWIPPVVSLADMPITHFIIAWRPGGSRTLGFSAQLDIPIGDCVRYGERVDEKGILRMLALEHRYYAVTGLVSDMPYEFKVCAVNGMGQGLWSDVSDPVVMKNPEKAPTMPTLVNFNNLVQLNETREHQRMKLQDWDVNAAYSADPMASQTQLTPRDRDGNILAMPRSRVLPSDTNPRVGWKESLKGTPDPLMIAELNRDSTVKKSILRTKDGFINDVFNHYDDGLEGNIMAITNDHSADSSVADSNQESQLRVGNIKNNDGDAVDSDKNNELIRTGTGGLSNLSRGSSLAAIDEQTELEEEENRVVEEKPMSETIKSNNKAAGLVKKGGLNYNYDDDEDDGDENWEADPTTHTPQQQPLGQALEIGAVVTTTTTELVCNSGDNNGVISSYQQPQHSQQLQLFAPPSQQQQDKNSDKSSVILDCKEVLHSLGLINDRQVHDLGLSSVYNGYSSGGEPIYTTSVPKEKYKYGTECLDYIFHSSATLIPTQLLSIPPLSELSRQGESPQEPLTTSDNIWLTPFPCANDCFKITSTRMGLASSEQQSHTDNNNADSAETDDTNTTTQSSGEPTAPSRYQIEATKRQLKALLAQSRIAGNPVIIKPIVAPTPSVSSTSRMTRIINNANQSQQQQAIQRNQRPENKHQDIKAAPKHTVWGGTWNTFPQANHMRANNFLPNEKYCSTHIALCVDFVINDNALATQWR